MKLILLLLISIINFSYEEKLERIYLPPNALSSGGSDSILEAPISRPIVVLDNDEPQRQIDESVVYEDEIQRPNIIEDQIPILTTASPALQRPTGIAISQNQFNVNNQEVNDVVRIGNHGNFFVQNQNSVDYKEVNYPGNVETVIHEDEIQRPNIIEDQIPILTTASPALQRPTSFAVSQNQFNVNNQEVNDVVRIGNHGNFFVQNQNSVDSKKVNYPGPSYQVDDQRQEHTQSSQERNVKILRQEYKNEGDAYAYVYETENGIWAEQNGVATNGVNAQGAYSYIGDDGVQYSMSYTADENGFQPKGDHIPTPHPIPEEILRSLEQNARDEAAGIFDDGSYDAQKYGGEDTGNQQRVKVVTSRPYTPALIQNRPTVPTIIDQGARNEDIVSIPNPLLLKYRTPGYRYTNIQLNEKNNNLSPVLSALMQEVTPSTVKSYLPPVKRKVSSENKPSKIVRKNEDKRRKPEPKKNDQKE